MEIKIRKANKKDIPSLIKLNGKLADYHCKLDRFFKSGREIKGVKQYMLKSLKARNKKVIVAEDCRNVIGFMSGSIKKAKDFARPVKMGKINTAFVLENYRRQKIGKEMIKIFFDWFRKRKIKYVELNVCTKNTIGVKTWQKLGFKEFIKNMHFELK